MQTKIEELEISAGLVELTLEGGVFTDGDYRPRITIRIPANVDKSKSVREIEKMILTYAQKEIDAQLKS